MTEYIQINLIDIIENKGEPFLYNIYYKGQNYPDTRQDCTRPLPNRSGHFLIHIDNGALDEYTMSSKFP